MKKQFVILFLLLATSLGTYAQLHVSQESQSSSQTSTSPGKLLSQIASNLRNDAYAKNFSKQKNAFVQQTATMTNPQEIASKIYALVGAIKPDRFKNPATAEKLGKPAENISSMTQVASLLKALESGLKPQAFSSMWQLERKNWIDNVHSLEVSGK